MFERVERFRVAPDERVLAREHRDLHRAIYAVGFSPRLAAVFSVHLLPYIEEAVNVGPGFGADPARLVPPAPRPARTLPSAEIPGLTSVWVGRRSG